jgi:hypothetical protein
MFLTSGAATATELRQRVCLFVPYDCFSVARSWNVCSVVFYGS